MKHGRAYKRWKTRLKNRRYKDMADYISMGSSLWFDKNKNRVKYSGKNEYKKFVKRCASRKARKDHSDIMNRSGYKKIYNVPNMLW